MFIVEEIRQAVSSLRSAPAFLALASSVLALGLGATIFMYGVINTTLLKVPPFPQAERLYVAFAVDPARNEMWGDINHLDYLEFRAKQRSFEDLGAYYPGTVIVSGDALPQRYTGGYISYNFLRVLRVEPSLGRDFTPADDAPSAPPVVLLSDELWRTRFGGNPGVLGTSVRINSRPTTVVGIMPPGFAYPTTQALWLPMARDASTEKRGSSNVTMGVAAIGRLKGGITAAAAADDLGGIAAELGRRFPRTNASTTVNLRPIAAATVTDAAPLLYSMFGAVWLVLIIACANVASLSFVRANFRVYEAGMRVALGARRSRLIVQMLAESLIVSLLGLAGAMALAAVGLHWIDTALRSLIDFSPPLWWKFSIDARVVAFAGGVALLAGLLAGIVPALRASRPDVMRILRDGGRTGTGMRLSRFTTMMVITEITLSTALVCGAGFMMQASFLSLQRGVGADISHFMSARIGLPESTYGPRQRARFFETMVAELAAQPGVLAASAASSMPGTGADEMRCAVEGRTPASPLEYLLADDVIVAPGFFKAMSRPLLAGRDFTAVDGADAAPAAIVNESFVRQHFAGRSPLGRRLLVTQAEGADRWVTIVGVAPDISHGNTWKAGGLQPTVYRPISQESSRFMTVAVKTASDRRDAAATLKAVAHRLDPELAPYWIMTLDELRTQRNAALHLLGEVFALFAVIAIIVAAVGIYGVLAFATGQRNREIGVRRALGAHDSQIIRAVLRGTGLQLAAGFGFGMIITPFMRRAIEDSLQGRAPGNLSVYVTTFTLLAVAALAASWLPALRALRIQPAAALRYE